MKYTLEIPDDEAAFVLEVIRRLSSAIKLTPAEGTSNPAETRNDTEHLMSSPANHARLLASLACIKRGEYTERPMLPDEQ